MAFEITVPRLGWSMEEGTFVRWLKQEGDYVKAGDAIFELEGEKAAQDIEAVDSGILRIPASAPNPGSVVPVGAVVGYLVAEGESIPSGHAIATPPKAEQPATTKPATAVVASTTGPVPNGFESTPAAPPSVRRLAREMGVKIGSVTGSGPAGRITADDLRTVVCAPNASRTEIVSQVASPRARRAAKERGLDWRQITGSGRDGRVRERDVLQTSQTSGPIGGTSVTVSSRRRTIASRMLASSQQTAPVTLTTRIDATNLVNLRNQFKTGASVSVVPSYSDIIIKLVTLSLRQHPMLAARSAGDAWTIPQSPGDLHVGFAVDTDDGLVVPVIQQAGSLGLFDLARLAASLIDRARTGKLTIAEMQGGVFTITNLGSFGIDAFTPIINLPETAVLGLGRIRREPVVVGEQIVPRDQMTLSLTFDHRIVDGAPAARFLQTLSQAIENPSAWLLSADQ